MAILETLAQEPSGLSMISLSRRLKVPPSSMSSLLYTLEQNGFIEREESTDKYRIGQKLAELGSVVLSSLKARHQTLPLLKKLLEESPLSDPLAASDEGEAVSVEKVESDRFLTLSLDSDVRDQSLQKRVARIRTFTESAVGTRKVSFQINPALGHMISFDMGTENLRVVVTDFVGKLLHFKKFPSEISKGKSHALGLIRAEIKRHLKQDPNIKGIALSVSGVVEPDTGTILFWPKVTGWEDVPIKEIIEKSYGLPTLVVDSARGMAIAEQSFGEGKNISNFIHVCIGMGIGAAIFTGGQLHSGCNGLAGELGHITVNENGDLCSCGNRGCLEVYASGSAIIRTARMALQEGVSSSMAPIELERLSVESVVAAAEAGDRLSYTILTEAAVHLGTALADIVNLLNPEKIILGAAVPRAAKDLLLQPLLRSLRNRAFSRSLSDLQVVISPLGDEAAAVGAALILAEKILQDALCDKIRGVAV